MRLEIIVAQKNLNIIFQEISQHSFWDVLVIVLEQSTYNPVVYIWTFLIDNAIKKHIYAIVQNTFGVCGERKNSINLVWLAYLTTRNRK